MTDPGLEIASPPSEISAPPDPLASARQAQRAWAELPIRERCARLRRFRHLAASQGDLLAADASPDHETPASAITAELLPLLDACRFLERKAPSLLAPRRLPRAGRSAWLGRIEFEMKRDPLGVVLIVGPSNYPLFLPGVQILQALTAGNAVIVKPAPGATAPVAGLQRLLREAGLDPALVTVLPEDVSSVERALEAGVDKVILTSSPETGRRVQELCARFTVPLTAELSGCDACFVLPGADLDRVVAALRFGLALNGGKTCIAPRRIMVDRDLAAALGERMRAVVHDAAPIAIDARLQPRLRALLDDAVAQGGEIIRPRRATDDAQGPFLVLEGHPRMALFRSEIFAPLLGVLPVADHEEALRLDDACPYALGASVFGPTEPARAFARRVNAGFVAVNDLIAPSADPRVPFGARKASGFGITRGAEGVLELTAPKMIAVRGRGRLRHLEPGDPADASLLGGLARLIHCEGWRNRIQAMRDLAHAARTRGRHRA